LTRAAGGDDAAAIIEVMIGNVLGPFITPTLLLAFLPRNSEFDIWRPSAASGVAAMYQTVFRQIGLSVLVPLALGQVVQWVFPCQAKWAVGTLHLAKVSTVCLILLVW
jgi:sodium/bile acid cotransporter 7